MSRTKIWLIVAVMSLALIGIAAMQVTWIQNMIRLNIEQFDENIFSALNATSDRLTELENQDAYANGFSIDYVERRFASRNSLDEDGNLISQKSASPILVSNGVAGHADNCTCTQCHNARMNNWQRYMRYNERAQEAPLETRIDQALLDTILRQELADHGIAEDEYTYGIFSRQRSNFIIVDGHYVVGEKGPINLIDDQPEGGSLETSKYAVNLYDNAALQAPGMLLIHFPQQSRIVMGPVWITIFISGLLLSIVLACFAYSIFIIFRQKRISMMKNDFISNMTHEFKTPIATISLAADSITNPKVIGSPDKLERFANIIRQENRRMNQQVEKVLQAAQIERRELKLKLAEVDVNELLAEAVSHMALQIEGRGGVLEMQLDAKNSVIEADPTHLSNVLHNLMDNANKYSPENPHISVRTEDTRLGVKVSVTDRGIGMTKEDQRQIFEQFFRVHTGNRHDVKGFGLGLSYVKASTEAHGGKVGVESSLGKGSTFTVEFPRKPVLQHA